MSMEKNSFEGDGNAFQEDSTEEIYPKISTYHDDVITATDPQKISTSKTAWSGNSDGSFDARQHRISAASLIPHSKKGWSSMSSLEKSLSIALGLVSILCLALMIAVVIVGIQLNEDDYKPASKPTSTTAMPPWVTTPEIPETTTPEAGYTTTTPRPRPTTTKPPDSSMNMRTFNICLTPECVKTAGTILHNLNPKVKPCEDFYQFSCGGWVETNPIPESESTWGQFDVLKEKLLRNIKSILESKPSDKDPEPLKIAQKFYNICLSQENKDESPLLSEFVNKALSELESNPSITLGTLRRVLKGNYLFSMFVTLDDEDTSMNTIYLDQPILGLPRKYLLGEPGNEIDAYTTLIKNIWSVFYPEDDNEIIALSIIELEKKLAKISTAEEDRRNKFEMYNSLTIEELSNLTDSLTIEWVEYFEEVFQDVIKNNDTFIIDNRTVVVVQNLEYFQQMASALHETDNKLLNKYLRWRIFNDYADEASITLRNYIFQYDQKVQGVKQPEIRSTECANEANQLMGMAISYRYVQNNIDGNYSDFTSKINELVEHLRTSFIEILKDVDWIASNDTRSIAKKKTENMRSLIGFPDWLLDQSTDSKLRKYYEKLSLSNPSSHLQNFLDIIQWSSENNLKRITEGKDESRWMMTPTTINAAYAPQHNSINLPLGILQAPFYADFASEISAINYGSIGVIIGHEITHGFDDTGRQNDENGNLRDWWDPKTRQNYNERDSCFQKQYSSYGLNAHSNIKVNGINTLGENIADNGGTREAYNAYQRYIAQNGEDKKLPGMDYTPDQLFFLSFAQTFCTAYTPEALKETILTGSHSPGPFRVKGVIENSEEFANAWSCPRPKNPNACKIW